MPTDRPSRCSSRWPALPTHVATNGEMELMGMAFLCGAVEGPPEAMACSITWVSSMRIYCDQVPYRAQPWLSGSVVSFRFGHHRQPSSSSARHRRAYRQQYIGYMQPGEFCPAPPGRPVNRRRPTGFSSAFGACHWGSPGFTPPEIACFIIWRSPSPKGEKPILSFLQRLAALGSCFRRGASAMSVRMCVCSRALPEDDVGKSPCRHSHLSELTVPARHYLSKMGDSS